MHEGDGWLAPGSSLLPASIWSASSERKPMAFRIMFPASTGKQMRYSEAPRLDKLGPNQGGDA